jgi:hypothetical protein
LVCPGGIVTVGVGDAVGDSVGPVVGVDVPPVGVAVGDDVGVVEVHTAVKPALPVTNTWAPGANDDEPAVHDVNEKPDRVHWELPRRVAQVFSVALTLDGLHTPPFALNDSTNVWHAGCPYPPHAAADGATATARPPKAKAATEIGAAHLTETPMTDLPIDLSAPYTRDARSPEHRMAPARKGELLPPS